MNVNDLIQTILAKVLGNPDEARAYAEDPAGYLTAEGLTDHDLTGIDWDGSIETVAAQLDLPMETRQALTSAPHETTTISSVATGASGHSSSAAPSMAAAPAPAVSPPPASPPPMQPPLETVQEHINYYTYVTYEGDESIVNNLVDNSTSFDVDVDGDVHGDLDLDIDNEVTNANALGDGAVAAGDDAQGVATGDGAVAAGRDIEDSQVNTGDGAVQADGDIEAPVNTGTNTGIIADDSDIEDTIVGDGNTQVNDSTNAVVGDGNQVAQNDGSGDQATGFGSGNVTTLDDVAIDDSAVAFGDGGASNVQDNDVTQTEQNLQNNVDVDTNVNQEFDDSFNEDSNLVEDVHDSNVAQVEAELAAPELVPAVEPEGEHLAEA